MDHDKAKFTTIINSYHRLALDVLASAGAGTAVNVLRGFLGAPGSPRHEVMRTLLERRANNDPPELGAEALGAVLDSAFAALARRSMLADGAAPTFLGPVDQPAERVLTTWLAWQGEMQNRRDGKRSRIAELPAGGHWSEIGEAGKLWMVGDGERVTLNGVERSPSAVAPWDRGGDE